MADQELARQIKVAAEKKGGWSLFLSDLPQGSARRALELGCLTPAGIGHFEVTEAGKEAAGQA